MFSCWTENVVSCVCEEAGKILNLHGAGQFTKNIWISINEKIKIVLIYISTSNVKSIRIGSIILIVQATLDQEHVSCTVKLALSYLNTPLI